MPWLSIIMAIISALASLKKNPDKKGQAVAAAALGGLGTYYVTHETEWGRDLLGDWDGVVVQPAADAKDPEQVTLPDGSSVGKTVVNVPSASTGQTTGLWDTLKSWGPTGTAAVIGTTAVTTSSSFSKYLPWLAGGLVLFLVLK